MCRALWGQAVGFHLAPHGRKTQIRIPVTVLCGGPVPTSPPAKPRHPPCPCPRGHCSALHFHSGQMRESSQEPGTWGECGGGGQSGWRAGATGCPRPGSLTTWFPPSGTGFAQQVGAMTSGKQRREGAWRGVPHSDLQRLSLLRSGARCPHAWATRGTSPAPPTPQGLHVGGGALGSQWWLVLLWFFQSKKVQFFKCRGRITPPFRS